MFRFFIVFLFIQNVGFAQHQDKVDFIKANIAVEPLPLQKEIKGTVYYKFRVLAKVDSVFLDAKNMAFNTVKLNDRKVKFSNNGKQIIIYKKFKKGETYALQLAYSCKPKQTVYFMGWDDTIDGNEQIWTQGQGKYTSHWLPSFDDMQEKVEFDLHIQTYKSNKVIANGLLVKITDKPVANPVFSFDMQKPMSSYLLAFAIGNYNKEELISSSGIPIENYYYPSDSLVVEPTYRYTKEIFNFLEKEIGVPYPWQNYKQVPVHDFLYAGMENTGATIFSDGFMIDSTAFVDKNYVNVNAHELAHQWFGNLVTEKNGNHHWLQEGFATYYAYLAEQQLFGEDYFYWKLFNTAKELQKLSEEGAGQALTDPKASSLTFYEKGAWALVMLKDKIGDKAFKKGISTYLDKYKFKNVTISDFINEMETASNTILSDFEEKWLRSTDFSVDDVKTFLMTKNPSIRMFYDSKQLNVESIGAMLAEDEPMQYKKALLKEFQKDLSPLLLLLPLSQPNVQIRQQAIQMLRDMTITPTELEVLQPVLEPLLYDRSYVTQELALFTLWVSYPEEKTKYLEQTKDVVGLPNKNIRLLWLTLAILTNEYDSKNTQRYFQELNTYTAPQYGWEVRMGAFQYLHQAVGLNEESLKNLLKATAHHSWQFKKFARNLVDELVTDTDDKTRFLALAKELKDDDLRYLNTKLKL